MSDRTILVTGANRGLGLEFVKQYAEIIACYRQPGKAERLNALQAQYSRIAIEALDVTDNTQIQNLQQKYKHQAIDILINNARIYDHEQGASNTPDKNFWIEAFKVNAIAPYYVSRAFSNNLKHSAEKKLILISSRLSIINEKINESAYAYRSSKIALNNIAKMLAQEYAGEFRIFSLNPGWVRTDMGGENADLSAEESVSHMRHVIEAINDDFHGHFYDYQGNHIDW